MSTVATGGGGGVFQARVGALYLANMLTGAPTAFGLHGARVETLRFEARYTGAHTDDIYCQLRGNEGAWLQLIQCKRGLDATPGNTEFVDGLQGAWRDFLGADGSPFDRARDVLVLATVAPATPANRAASATPATDLINTPPPYSNIFSTTDILEHHGSRSEGRRHRLQDRYRVARLRHSEREA